MNLIPHDKMMLVIDAIERGYSRSQIAKYAGVSERTAASYRSTAKEAELVEPESCGCGRPLKHQGRCQWRRDQAEARHSGRGKES